MMKHKFIDTDECMYAIFEPVGAMKSLCTLTTKQF